MTAFPSRPDCPLPLVAPIPNDLVKDCRVPEAPDMMCEALVFPSIVPPVPIGCPIITLNTRINNGENEVVQGKLEKPSSKPTGDKPFCKATFRGGVNKDDNCLPILDFDIYLPKLCTKIKIGKVKGVNCKVDMSASNSRSCVSTINLTVSVPKPKDGKDGKDGDDGQDGDDGTNGYNNYYYYNNSGNGGGGCKSIHLEGCSSTGGGWIQTITPLYNADGVLDPCGFQCTQKSLEVNIIGSGDCLIDANLAGSTGITIKKGPCKCTYC